MASVKPHQGVEPEEAAKAAIARRTKTSALPGHVKLVLTLAVVELAGEEAQRRIPAERLSARAIREGKNLEIVEASP